MEMMKTFFSNTVLIIFLFDSTFTKSNDNQSDFVSKHLKKLTEKGKKCSLNKITQRNLNHLRLSSEDDRNTIVCLLTALGDKEFQSSGHLWTSLGTLYGQIGQKSDAATCFKYAAKLSGKVSSYIKEWSFLGPFVIGKSELDGNPVEAFGGITQTAKLRYKKNIKFYSELVNGGEISWTHLKQASEESGVQIKPSVNWNQLVNSLGSMGITEWQGWFVGEFAVNEKDMNIVVQCLGVHTVLIDDMPITGDVYHRNKYWYGIKLNPGLHTVYINLRTEVNGQFSCKFQNAKNNFAVLEPNFLPDLVSGHLFGKYFAVTIMNYQHSSFLKISKVTLTDLTAKDGEIVNKLDIKLIDSDVSLAPGQVQLVGLQLESKSGESAIVPSCSEPESSWDIQFNVKFTTSSGIFTLPVSMRCRHDRQSFLYTFVDHDGSIQQAAAIQPLKDCPDSLCPVVMSMHGTSIPPQNQADSYKHMVDGEFQFGFDQAWTLAPTRHGAHNWEGPGSLTAISALNNLEELTKHSTFLNNKADAHHVVFAGHSMGGHGAWHVATHYPDRAVALVSLAGWIKKEEYGDDNLFFRHDIGTSHVQPAVKAILESCFVENDVDQHVTNLHGIPVVVRIGAEDRTVHPVFSRRMYRLLREEGFSVNYTEVKDKEHWWWDTVETNDGGAVHDKYLRDFTNTQINSYLQQQSESGCDGGECGVTMTTNKYTNLDLKFTLTSYNPAAMEGMHGVRILRQITPHRKSELQVHVTAGNIKIQTDNVQMFSLSHSANRPVHWEEFSIMVDGTSEVATEEQPLNFKDKNEQTFCKKQSSWSSCTEDGPGTRHIATIGPARRVAEQPFKIIIGTTGLERSRSYIQQAAVYLANLFFLTSDTRAPIVKDSDISTEDLGLSNVIVIGNTTENLHTAALLEKTPMKTRKDGVHLHGCNYKTDRTGILTLAHNGPTHLALLLLGTSQQGLQDVMSLAAPTIPPMTRSPFSNQIPDYIITGPSVGRKGPGGYLCTGFYGNQWEYRADLSSCICAI